MDRGGEWTEVASGQRWRVDRVGYWTKVLDRCFIKFMNLSGGRDAFEHECPKDLNLFLDI